jgi:ribonucleoside-diphosphate reductase alpha chain
MGVLRVDHPDIEAFVGAKDTGNVTHFNLSIGVSDDIAEADRNR